VSQLGRYEILGELGRGGMATVLLASQRDLDRLVALKRLDALAGDDDIRVRRFVREARLAASLSHPNIVTVHDAFEADGAPYIAMEYVAGGTLRELMPGLSLEQIAGVLDGVLAGLTHAERQHIVHRDLKPENLMVTGDGAIKITDFGIAKATSVAREGRGTLTSAGATVGTPAYMAPEQVLGRDPDPRTDLYALGVIAFELLTGRRPFLGGESQVGVLMQHVSDPPPVVAELRPAVDPELSSWVGDLLAKAPEDRPPCAAAAREALEDLVLRLRGPRWRRDAPLPVLPTSVPPRPPAQERHDRHEPPPAAMPAGATVHSRRRPRGRGAAFALVIAVAVAAIAFGARRLGEMSPAMSVSERQAPVATAAPEEAIAPADPVPIPATPSPRSTPATATATATATAPAPATVDPGRVADAQRQSQRFAEEAQDTEGDGDELLTQQLRDAEYAYRDAATAGAAGDGAAFAAALARADRLAQLAVARLDGN
jgi:predicted Ser/Thr protein kinase